MHLAISRSIIRLDGKKKKKLIQFLRPRSLFVKVIQKKFTPGKHGHSLPAKKGEKFDYFLSLPPTSPLRIKKDIENLIENFLKNKSDITVTVARTSRNPHFNMDPKKAEINLIKINKKNFQRFGEFFRSYNSWLYRKTKLYIENKRSI